MSDEGVIPFTQFLLPDGRKIRSYIDRPRHIAEKAQQIIAAGFRFEIEILRTGDVSLTITGRNCDVEIRVVPNGPQVPEAVDDMINKFVIEEALQIDEEAGA